jgi:hypothetical protein
VPEQVFEMTFSVNYAKNENVISFDAINKNVIACCKTAYSRAELAITRASCVRKTGEKEKRSVMDSISRVATSMLPLSVAT